MAGRRLTSIGPFKAKPDASTLDLTINRGPDRTEITCVVRQFTWNCPPVPGQCSSSPSRP